MRIRWRDFELPSGVTLEESSATESFGRFFVEPFQQGFGHTIGNGLRRVLLSSIEGTSITGVSIDGVEHEFKTMEGVVEDVTDIVLALKDILVSLDGDGPVTLSVDKTGPCTVTAGDVECPTGVTVMNPELEICKVTGDGTPFKAELTVRRGRGFVASEETGEPMDQIGHIPMDAGFSPVRRVRYGVEATRVGKFTNYDRLVLEIWTDGTLAPQLALTEAAKIYRKHLNPFLQSTTPSVGVPVAEEVQAIDAAAERRKERHSALMSESIDRLELSTRARNCLDSSGILVLGDLVYKSKDDLIQIKNLGQTVLTEIEQKLAELDLSVGMIADEGAVAGT
jgi:DNA-directed RNA polymerase subunit alpha